MNTRQGMARDNVSTKTIFRHNTRQLINTKMYTVIYIPIYQKVRKRGTEKKRKRDKEGGGGRVSEKWKV